MKSLLRKLLFWDAPAQGVCFALTFFFVGSSLWFTLFQMLWLSNCGLVQLNFMSERCAVEICVWAGGQILITAYSLIVFLRALVSFARHCIASHHYKTLSSAVAALFVWLCGGLFCLVPSFHLINSFVFDEKGRKLIPCWIPLFTSLPPHGWWLAYLVAVLCMVAGGFFLVRTVARAENKPLRAALCKTGVVLWCVFWLAYLLCLTLALVQSKACSLTRSLVAKRFGYSLTAEGLQEFYAKQGETDAEFWKRLSKINEQLPSKITVGNEVLKYWDGRLPDELTSEWLSAFEAYCNANQEPLHEMETCFDAIPPLPSRNFEPGNLVFLERKELSICRAFIKLELSRLRVFSARKDSVNALRAYQRIANCTAHVQREPFLIGGLVWLALEHKRLEAMECLLASRLLTDADLLRLAADLTALEERIPVMLQQTMLTEAALGQDTLWGLETGKARNSVIAFGDLRFFYPSLWFQVARDKMYMLNQYLSEDFSAFNAPPSTAYLFTSMLSPAFKSASNKFKSLTACTRCLQALMKAEVYRREHGNFPESLSDLPLDPFTGSALHYKYGMVECLNYAPQASAVFSPPSLKNVKAVQVWSIGPNRKDDGGLTMPIDSKDDPCARIRLEQ